MGWITVLIRWLIFQVMLDGLQPGQETQSPEFEVRWQDGRRFFVKFEVMRAP